MYVQIGDSEDEFSRIFEGAVICKRNVETHEGAWRKYFYGKLRTERHHVHDSCPY